MIYWIFIGISSIILVISAGVGISNYSWLTGATNVKGQVVELVEKRSKKGRHTYAPKVSYDLEGELREFTSSQSSNPPDFQVGEEVPVAVNLDKNKYSIATFGEIYGFPVFGGLLGLAILTGTLILMNGVRLFKIIHPNLG